MKKVLVTGCAGYIGSVLTHILLENNYTVLGYDYLAFGGQSLLDIYNHPNFTFTYGDVRDEKKLAEVIQLHKPHYCVHLAAIVGDPACRKFEKEANEINLSASKNLFSLCQSNNLEKFVFASTCSNYGKMKGTDMVDENSTLNPVSLYARTKVEMEDFIINSKLNGMLSTVLRFSTVYGVSPRMRFDLTVNEFTRDLTMGKPLEIFGQEFWRPYCHVNDLARSVLFVLNCTETTKIDNQVFNVGDSTENYQKQNIIDEIRKILPDISIKYINQPDDPRDYKVKFEKIKNQLGFSITKKVIDGIKEINNLLDNKIIADPYDKKYSNI
jgi:nucleoside-diphosphate-sugar epimerase